MLLFAYGYWTVLLGKTHCKGNPQFNFHKYMMRVLEADFKVVGIHMELISISCILFFKLCILASIFLQLVSMEIRGNFLVAERGWMACILLYSICSLHSAELHINCYQIAATIQVRFLRHGEMSYHHPQARYRVKTPAVVLTHPIHIASVIT
ncbi:MLO-like protein 1 [Linum perenne]